MPENSSLKKGEILFAQGETPSELILLQSGSLEILSASKEYEGLDRSIISSRSRRVGVIKAKTLIAGISGMMNQTYSKTLRAVEDCQLTRYPLRQGGFSSIAAADVSQAVTVIRHSFNLINTLLAGLTRYGKLLQTLRIINDNISLIYKALGGSYAPDEYNDNASELFSSFQSSGAKLPETLGAKFLITDLGRCFNKDYSLNGSAALAAGERTVLDLLMKILKTDPALHSKLFSADPSITVSFFSILVEGINRVFESIDEIMDGIDLELSKLFSAELSWATILVDEGGFDEWLDSGRVEDSFVKDTLSLIVKINSLYEELTGVKLTDSYSGVRKIHQYYMKQSSPGQNNTQAETAASGRAAGTDESGSSPVTGGGAGAPSDLKHSIHQIFEFSLIDKEFQTKFLKILTDFKKMKNPFNTESEGRKMRRTISKFYWDLYKQVYVRSMSQPSVPKAVKLMLNFGYLDEELMEPEQLADLNELVKHRERDVSVPVCYESEFLSKIYGGEEEPSDTEMGQNYAEFIKEQEKHGKKKEAQTVQVGDENIRKVLFEIDQRLASNVAICSGSTSTAFPILTAYAIKGSLKSIFVTKKMVEDALTDLLAIDFSPFFRETVLKLGEAREIIKEEVVPYFIILPSYGVRFQLWQDMVGINKRSMGRICLPTFFMGDFKKSLAHSIACYRWELNITMKGAMWGDPIEGGLTGEYFDYINTFKKMSKLSQEAKEKIAERFKSLRTNRDRFADDYLSWTTFEKDGIMKLNTVVREMFFKHIPFRKDIRERLGNMPAFMQAATRYKNIHTRDNAVYFRKFQKYRDDAGALPIAIEKFLEYLEM